MNEYDFTEEDFEEIEKMDMQKHNDKLAELYLEEKHRQVGNGK